MHLVTTHQTTLVRLVQLHVGILDTKTLAGKLRLGCNGNAQCLGLGIKIAFNETDSMMVISY